MSGEVIDRLSAEDIKVLARIFWRARERVRRQKAGEPPLPGEEDTQPRDGEAQSERDDAARAAS
jgi:hypothetical protein